MSERPIRGTNRRPLVGITGGLYDLAIAEGILPSHCVDSSNPHAVTQAGGDPVLIPAVESADPSAPERYAEALDAFVFAGGIDIAPSVFGGEGDAEQSADHVRDRFEIALLHAARARRKPVLGVCRGMELINVACGGTLRDVEHPGETEPLDGFERAVFHTIDLAPGSAVASAYEQARIGVACLHHQAPETVPELLTVSAWASDGTVEAIEGPADGGFLVGLLWHPEYLVTRDSIHLRPYRALIRAAYAATGAEPLEAIA